MVAELLGPQQHVVHLTDHDRVGTPDELELRPGRHQLCGQPHVRGVVGLPCVAGRLERIEPALERLVGEGHARVPDLDLGVVRDDRVVARCQSSDSWGVRRRQVACGRGRRTRLEDDEPVDGEIAAAGRRRTSAMSCWASRSALARSRGRWPRPARSSRPGRSPGRGSGRAPRTRPPPLPASRRRRCGAGCPRRWPSRRGRREVAPHPPRDLTDVGALLDLGVELGAHPRPPPSACRQRWPSR